ncbi:hypothetical protein SGPA1_31356 [Streptomyces misionensis JCM 4497]
MNGCPYKASCRRVACGAVPGARSHSHHHVEGGTGATGTPGQPSHQGETHRRKRTHDVHGRGSLYGGAFRQAAPQGSGDHGRGRGSGRGTLRFPGSGSDRRRPRQTDRGRRLRPRTRPRRRRRHGQLALLHGPAAPEQPQAQPLADHRHPGRAG